MGIKNLFTGNKTISRKNLRKNYRQDPTFRKIMSDPEIKKVLDQPEEQRELHDMIMEKAARGSLKGDDARIVFDELARKGKGEHISREEGRRVAARVFTDSSRRYKSEKQVPDKDTNMAVKPKAVSPAYFAYRAKLRSASSGTDRTGKKPSFFDSMRSVRKNKQI